MCWTIRAIWSQWPASMMRGCPSGFRTARTLPWRSVRTSSARGRAHSRTTSCTGRSKPAGLGDSRRRLRNERDSSRMVVWGVEGRSAPPVRGAWPVARSCLQASRQTAPQQPGAGSANRRACLAPLSKQTRSALVSLPEQTEGRALVEPAVALDPRVVGIADHPAADGRQEPAPGGIERLHPIAELRRAVTGLRVAGKDADRLVPLEPDEEGLDLAGRPGHEDERVVFFLPLHGPFPAPEDHFPPLAELAPRDAARAEAEQRQCDPLGLVLGSI